ncbi:MAG: hypothetical protein ACK5Z0_07815 [Planctomycetota bacterium]
MKTILRRYREFALNAATWMMFGLSAICCDACQTENPTHDGEVVSVTDGKLVMTGEDGHEHSHSLGAKAKLTLDGKVCRPADLKPGIRVRVTTGVGESAATRVEAIERNRAFASHVHDGKFVSVKGEQLVMTNAAGNEESLKLRADAIWTLDGKTCQNSALKPGGKVRVFTPEPFSLTAIRIEAIDRNPEFASDRHDGKLVSLSGEKLAFTSPDGQEHDLSLPKGAVVTLDGNACKAADLKPGTRIRVTTRDAYSTVATGIEAIDSKSEFASEFHDGLVVNIAGNQLVMTDVRGNNEHNCNLSADVKITLDGKLAKSSELKSGMRIRVTSGSSSSHSITRIEAIEKNSSFKKSL